MVNSRYLFCCIVFFNSIFITSYSSAQYNKDSLKHVIASDKIHDTLKVSAYLKLARFYFNTNFEKFLKISKEINYNKGVIIALNNLADTYLEMDSLDRALEFYKESLYENSKNTIQKSKAFSLNGIAKIYRLKGDYKKVERYMKETLALYAEIDEKMYLAQAMNFAGSFYFETGKNKDAEDHLVKALQYSQQAKSHLHIRDAAKSLADLYETSGDFETALAYYKQYQQYADSVINKENTRKIVKETLELQHQNEIHKIELEQKEKDLLTEKEKTKQVALRNTFMAGFVFVFILAVIIFRGLRRNRKKSMELKELNEEIRSQKEFIISQNEELTATNKKLVELDRFKEAMTGMIVHDLKNPLNAILNIAPKEDDQFVPRVRNYGKQMLNMVLNILDLQKYENSTMHLELREEELIPSIEKGMEEVCFLCEEKNISFQPEINGHFEVLADIAVLNRIIVNLLTNAIKYSPNNESICIRTVETSNMSRIRIEVCDKGPGIPMAQQKDIFNRFAQRQAKDSGKIRSTGLGLAFCKLAVEAHGGEIGVESEHGKGSCFWFTLLVAAFNANIPDNKNIALGESMALPELSRDEIRQIKQSLIQLRGTKIYQISQLRKILANIDEGQSENIKKWKMLVKKAIQTEDQKTFIKLIDVYE